jgi:hypothetical protein
MFVVNSINCLCSLSISLFLSLCWTVLVSSVEVICLLMKYCYYSVKLHFIITHCVAVHSKGPVCLLIFM